MTFNERSWLRPPSSIHKGWRYRVGIELPDDDNPSDEVFLAARGAVVAQLRTSPDFSREDITGVWLRDVIDLIETSEDVEEFNEALDELYDWGDSERVIIN